MKKKASNIAPAEKEIDSVVTNDSEENTGVLKDFGAETDPPKRRRGRPQGTKNKVQSKKEINDNAVNDVMESIKKVDPKIIKKFAKKVSRTQGLSYARALTLLMEYYCKKDVKIQTKSIKEFYLD